GILMAQSLFASTATLSILSGAQVTVGTISVAATPNEPQNGLPTATINLQGGSLNITSDLVIGDTFNDIGTVNVSTNGVLSVGAGGQTDFYSGIININGGTADLKTLNYVGGTINFTAGALSYIGDLFVGSGGVLGADLSVSSNRILTLSGTTTVAPFHS